VKILIVFAHPEPLSFNGAMLKLALSELTSIGHTVDVSNLYEINSNPVAGPKDFLLRKDSEHFQLMREQLNAIGNGRLTPDILAQHEKLKWADLVIFQFPLWWRGLPGILKGYFDRVFTYGFAYGGTKGKYQNGGFHGKLAMLSISLASSADEFTEYGKSGVTIEQMLHPIHHGILAYCGFRVIHPFVAYEIQPDTLSEIRQNHLENYRKWLRNLDTTPAVY